VSEPKSPTKLISDEKIELLISDILLGGVVLSALIVAIGAGLYLFRHGMELHDYHRFKGEPGDLRDFGGIITDAMHFEPRGIIQVGLLALVATPICRVAFTLIAFFNQGDRKYVVITAVVLAALIYGLWGG